MSLNLWKDHNSNQTASLCTILTQGKIKAEQWVDSCETSSSNSRSPKNSSYLVLSYLLFRIFLQSSWSFKDLKGLSMIASVCRRFSVCVKALYVNRHLINLKEWLQYSHPPLCCFNEPLRGRLLFYQNIFQCQMLDLVKSDVRLIHR